MKPGQPIRPRRASRGGLSVGAWLLPLPAVSPLTAHRAGSRFGGLPAAKH